MAGTGTQSTCAVEPEPTSTDGAAGGPVGPTSGETPVARPWRSHAQRHGFGATDFEVLERSQWGTRLLYDFPVPIICALKGWTLGTAFERALLCDVRVAGEGTRMALAGIDHGLIPDAAGVAKLYEIGGSALALDLALTGPPDRRRRGAAPRAGVAGGARRRAWTTVGATTWRTASPSDRRWWCGMVREHVQALAAPAVRGTLGRELVGQTLVLASHDFERAAPGPGRGPRAPLRTALTATPSPCTPCHR